MGATSEAVQGMLGAINASGMQCGVKVSGGLRTLEQALFYLNQVKSGLHLDVVHADQFRIGASGLHAELVKALQGELVTDTLQSEASY